MEIKKLINNIFEEQKYYRKQLKDIKNNDSLKTYLLINNDNLEKLCDSNIICHNEVLEKYFIEDIKVVLSESVNEFNFVLNIKNIVFEDDVYNSNLFKKNLKEVKEILIKTKKRENLIYVVINKRFKNEIKNIEYLHKYEGISFILAQEPFIEYGEIKIMSSLIKYS